MINTFTATKEKLIKVLKKHDTCRMKDIMNYFDVSEIAIRRHLRDLMRLDLVEEESVKQSIGRPYKQYRLTSKGHELFPNQYKELPVELLRDLEELQGKEVVADLLNKRKEREEAEYLAELRSADFHKRIKELIDLQVEKGYMVEVNEIADGYEIINYNCPIKSVASSYEQVCRNEQDILEKVFPNSRVKSHSKISKGESYCKWTISDPS